MIVTNKGERRGKKVLLSIDSHGYDTSVSRRCIQLIDARKRRGCGLFARAIVTGSVGKSGFPVAWRSCARFIRRLAVGHASAVAHGSGMTRSGTIAQDLARDTYGRNALNLLGAGTRRFFA